MDGYRRTEFSMSIVKNYNLTYSFYKNTYSWGSQGAPDCSLQVLSGALTLHHTILPAKTRLLIENCSVIDTFFDNSMFSVCDYDSSLDYSMCSMCSKRCTFKSRQRLRVSFTIRNVLDVVVLHGANVLFWYNGRNKRKVQLLYGYRAAQYYRWCLFTC